MTGDESERHIVIRDSSVGSLAGVVAFGFGCA
jgi:hypothetical protein